LLWMPELKVLQEDFYGHFCILPRIIATLVSGAPESTLVSVTRRVGSP